MAFFRTPRKFLLTGLLELHSTCPQNCFQGKQILCWKTFFKLYFTIWAVTFHVFGKIFPPLLSKLHVFLGSLTGLTPTFLGLYAKFYWQVCQNSTLRVHRIAFTGSIFFEKKTHFYKCFSQFSRIFFWFLGKSFQAR